MKLKVILGSDSSVNKQVIYYAAEHLPALIIDCANVANPHRYFPRVTEAQFARMYVVELEMLYKLRDVLSRVPATVEKIQAKSVVVTTAHHLMNYQDKQENKDIYNHVWDLLISIGHQVDTIIAVVPNSIHEHIVQRLPSDTHSVVSAC